LENNEWENEIALSVYFFQAKLVLKKNFPEKVELPPTAKAVV